MTVSAQIPQAGQYCTTKVLCQALFAIVWFLLLRVSPLAAQQDTDESSASVQTDESTVSNAEAYTGPAMLSRGNQPAITGAQADTIQPFLNISRIYGTGLTGGLSGTSTDAIQSGLQLGFGLKGTHRWKRVTLQIEYQGDYRDYSGQTAVNAGSGNGLNQLLVATVLSQLRRHLVLSIRQTGGILRQDIGGLLVQPAFFESSSTSPANEPFSNGLKLFGSVVTLTYQETPRLSFSGSVEESLLRQDSLAIVGTNSSIVGADVSYRLSPRSSVGVDYSFSRFSYTTFGSSDVNRAAVDYSWRAAKTVDLGFQLGVARIDTTGLGVVPLDPEIAQLLGETTGIQPFYRSTNVPVANARVSKQWRRASADLSLGRGISGGNGLVLASTQTSMTAGLHYSHADRWTVSVQAGRTMMDQLATAGSYTGNTFGGSFSRLMRPGLQAVGRFSVLPINYTGPQGVNRTYYRGEVGIIFTPNQVPVALR